MPRTPVQQLIREEAARQGVPPALALAIAEQESQFNPTAINPQRVTGGQQARGVFQLLPTTAQLLGVNPDDPAENVRGGVKYLRQLLDQHKDLDRAIGTYGGVVTNQTYIPQVKARMAKYAASGAPPAAPVSTTMTPMGAPPKPPAPPPPPSAWAQAHPWLNEMIESYDPNERAGRQNIAGSIGSIGGGFLGGLVGTAGGTVAGGAAGAPTGPGAIGTAAAGGAAGLVTGAKIGSAVGAGIMGAAEQALIEETGLGDRFAAWFPGDTNTPTTVPGDSTAFGRTAAAGADQLASDIFGQGLGAGFRAGGKRLLQSRVGRYAHQAFSAEARAMVARAQGALDILARSARRSTAARNAEMRAASAAARRAEEEARLLGTQTVADIKKAEGDKVRTAIGTLRGDTARLAADEDVAAQQLTRARQAAADAVGAARETGDTAVREARARAAETIGAADVAGAEERRAAGDLFSLASAGPASKAVAGRLINDVYEGPAKAAKDAVGREVEAAAEAIPEVTITEALDKARQMFRDEVLPTAQHFPRQIPPSDVSPVTLAGRETGEQGVFNATGDYVENAADRTIAQGALPTPEDPLFEISRRITEAEALKQAQDPLLAVLNRMSNATNVVPGKVAHQWKRELQAAVGTAYDAARRSADKGAIMKLAGLMRKALSKDARYNAATEAYEQVEPLFSKGVLEQMRQLAIDNPEQIVKMLDPTKPTQAAMLVEVLTTQAEAGGGGKLGQQALTALQDAWMHEHLLGDGIEKLGENLTRLMGKNKEFADAVLNTPGAKAKLANYAEIAAGFNELVEKIGVEQAQAKAAAALGIETAEAAKRAGLGTARRTGTQATRTAERDLTAVRGQKKAAETTGRTAVQSARQARADAIAEARRRMAEAARTVVEQGREAVEGTRTRLTGERLGVADELQDARITLREARAGTPEARAFADSTLAGERSNVPDIINVAGAAAGLGGGWRGMSWGRLFKGASDRDMLTFLAHSPGGTRLLVNLMMRGTLNPLAKEVLVTAPSKATTDLLNVTPRDLREGIGEIMSR